ncbi:hypothetical protein RJT34_26780 [Clitoria ternatea]|uniref:DUF7950 domain-containing protein n=1 Tax=Clitoria ternatea TaxID=43366 RepID=A0AAN9I881_CLITE
MDGGDVWRVAACSNTNGAPHDNTILNTIMLRFRPIAPKPVAGSPVSVAAGEAAQSSHVSVLGKRPKRKYVRIRRNSGYVRKNGNNNNSSDSNINNNEDEKSSAERRNALDDVSFVTLQLMPEKDAPERGLVTGDSWCKNVDLDVTLEKIQIVENLRPPCATANAGAVEDSDQVQPVETWVTVESVTGTCMGDGGLGCTDAEKVRNLETDTCPGFVCDGGLRVRWVNDAYKRMVVSEEERDPRAENIGVRLKLKDSFPTWVCYSHPAFTCGVRLQYTWRNEKCTKMVPCDVWRLDCGGFAWRLDVKAALSLGL